MAAQRRGYNTCHVTGLRLLRNRGEADVLRSIKACSGSLLPPACSSQATHWRFWEFSDQAIRRDNNVDSIDTLQYAREIAGQRANWPASFGRRHVASASDLLRRRRWTWRSSLYRRRWSWRSSLRRGKYRLARHLRFVQITLPLALQVFRPKLSFGKSLSCHPVFFNFCSVHLRAVGNQGPKLG